MSARMAFKRFFFSATAVGGSAATSHSMGPECIKKTACSCKPSQLPLYCNECQACNAAKAAAALEQTESGQVEQCVSKVRKEIWVWQKGVEDYKQSIVEFTDTGISHASSSIDFLREESNGPERAGAIALSTLSGFILGLRGGIFKRLTYAVAGGLSMAGICFPREAADYSQKALDEANGYFVAGYHFAFGEAPKLPSWLESVFGDTKKKIEEVKTKIKQ